jgi:hypothetical protein
MKYAYIPFFAFFIVTLSGCEKDIDVELPIVEHKVVVEGSIENDELPLVFLTRSIGYFEALDSADLINQLVLDAVVTVSDGVDTDTLELTFNPSIFPPIFYKGRWLKGEAGKSYALQVIADGKVLTAVTSIPEPVQLDSLWFKVEPGMDSLGWAWGHLTDPPVLGNAYRWFARRIGKDSRFIAPLGSVFEDKFINGKSFDFAYNRGSEQNSEANDDHNEERGFFKIGDTVEVKFCSIDKAHFEFWRSAETEIFSNGNPFASPSTIRSNIKGGGLGVWGGYGAAFHSFIAK